MITIIYSTKKDNRETYDHLRQSCGVPNVEVIQIINPGIMSLTQAYQNGLERAKYDICVFIHDDVKLEDRWGRKLKNLFDTTDYGIIGLAGTTDLDATGKWWEQRNRMVGIVRHTNGKKTWENKYSGAFPKQIIPTVNVDGLFIAAHKQRIKYQFDTTIPGFHFYDIDFTFGNYVNGTKVGVTTDIKAVHRGLGETDQQWETNRLAFIEKFKDNLPASIVPDPIVDKIEIKDPKLSPKVVIVIHGKDPKKIEDCAYNIFNKTSYPSYRIVACYSDYDDVPLKNDELFSEVIDTTIDNYSANSNKIIENHLRPDDEIIVFMTENSLIQNDVISLGVKQIQRHKDCGTITARVYNEDKTIYNVGYEVWNLIQPSTKPNEQPQSSLLVNLLGNGGYYSFINSPVLDTIGGTKDFMMCNVDLCKRIKFNGQYKKAFMDLEFNLKSINDKKINMVLGNGVIQLRETVVSDPEYYEDLNKVFLPFVYSQGLSTIDKYIKNHIIPNKE